MPDSASLTSEQISVERSLSASQALARLLPRLSDFGITRLARQTGLDVLGIPCFAAIRPNAATLSSNQGKGRTDDQARISAVMEAAEYHSAERPTAPVFWQKRSGIPPSQLLWPAELLPADFRLDEASVLPWVEGHPWQGHGKCLVPIDAVTLVPMVQELRFARSTNGLAAGATAPEASTHGLFELIERDAMTLWSLRRLPAFLGRLIDQKTISELAPFEFDHLKAAGIDCKVFDLTTDLEVPVFMALLAGGPPSLYFDVASGVCCHADPQRALQGAIQEAAQTRVVNVAGARDDIDAAEYDRPVAPWLAKVWADTTPAQPWSGPRKIDQNWSAALKHRLDARGIKPIVVPLTAAAEFPQIVHVLASGLEDRPTNRHWRPGPRARSAMLQLL